MIPFGLDDELQSRYLSEKKLEVLAFTKSHNVPPYLHNGDQAHVVMGVDECVSIQNFFCLVISDIITRF